MRQLVLALFALNRTYLLSDRTALDEIDDFSSAPPRFSARVRGLLDERRGARGQRLDPGRPLPRGSRQRGRALSTSLPGATLIPMGSAAAAPFG